MKLKNGIWRQEERGFVINPSAQVAPYSPAQVYDGVQGNNGWYYGRLAINSGDPSTFTTSNMVWGLRFGSNSWHATLNGFQTPFTSTTYSQGGFATAASSYAAARRLVISLPKPQALLITGASSQTSGDTTANTYHELYHNTTLIYRRAIRNDISSESYSVIIQAADADTLTWIQRHTNAVNGTYTTFSGTVTSIGSAQPTPAPVVWYKMEPANMWQDDAGTSQVTADAQQCRRVSDLSGNNNYARYIYVGSVTVPTYRTAAGNGTSYTSLRNSQNNCLHFPSSISGVSQPWRHVFGVVRWTGGGLNPTTGWWPTVIGSGLKTHSLGASWSNSTIGGESAIGLAKDANPSIMNYSTHMFPTADGGVSKKVVANNIYAVHQQLYDLSQPRPNNFLMRRDNNTGNAVGWVGDLFELKIFSVQLSPVQIEAELEALRVAYSVPTTTY